MRLAGAYLLAFRYVFSFMINEVSYHILRYKFLKQLLGRKGEKKFNCHDDLTYNQFLFKQHVLLPLCVTYKILMTM